jgi:CBS domain-containing protein
MLPAFPLDGGRVLRSILWKRSGNITRATQTAARVGRAFGFVMIGLGVIELLEFGVGGIWLILVGFFITTAARAELAGLQMRTTFAESVAGDLMSAPAVTILGAMPADEAAQFFTRYRFTSFPVVDVDDRVVGLLDIAHLRAAGALDGLRADGLADSDPELLAAASDPVVGLLERPAFSRVGRLVVVDADRKALGLLSITDAQRAVRAAEVAEPVRA